jgi:hypothetical protein
LEKRLADGGNRADCRSSRIFDRSLHWCLTLVNNEINSREEYLEVAERAERHIEGKAAKGCKKYLVDGIFLKKKAVTE